jgi:hypothetical protein
MAFLGRSLSIFASPLVWLLACAAPVACYKPNILDGGLRCAPDAGTRTCPEGFKCDPASQTCRKNVDGGRDGDAPGADVNDAMDATEGDVRDGPICFESKVGCAPQGGRCDPFCQTGCGGCREKCSLNTAGALTCNEPLLSQFPRTLLQACTIASEGDDTQTDNCAQGFVCLADPACPARCFQFCRNDNECTNSSCTREVGRADGGVVRTVCDVPFVDSCVPLPGSQNSGCPSLNMACYISSASPTHTICDCPFNAVGPGYPCTRTRECIPGLACVDRGNGGSICLQVCRLSDNGITDCPSHTAGACRMYTGNPPGATAHATYGFCMP